jgi:hypothetical protein
MMATDVEPEVMHKLGHHIAKATQMTMMLNKTGNPFDVVFIGLAAAQAALTAVAYMVGPNDNPNSEAGSRAVTDETLIFAALLLAVSGGTSRNHEGEPCVDVHFGPEQVLEAMNWYEKITGVRPDKHLNPDFVEIMQKFTASAETPLVKFMASRPQTKPLH